MVPTETTVETGISAEQSRLRKVSNAYIEQAEREAWVQKGSGLLGFAKVLMDGAKTDDSSKSADYYDHVSAGTSSTEMVVRITTDIDRAKHGLDVATIEAKRLLETPPSAKGLRVDLVSYESVLVTAKKARRTFAASLSRVEAAPELGAYEAADKLSQLDESIEVARKMADTLADFTRDYKKQQAKT